MLQIFELLDSEVFHEPPVILPINFVAYSICEALYLLVLFENGIEVFQTIDFFIHENWVMVDDELAVFCWVEIDINEICSFEERIVIGGEGVLR